MMTRKPDEVKKGLEFCVRGNCTDCPYSRNCVEKNADALALIQQLQADNAQLSRCIETMTDKLNAMNDEVAKLQAERDAAVADLKTVCGMCSVCCACKDRFEGGKACRGCVNSSHWQWRGVQKEE